MQSTSYKAYIAEITKYPLLTSEQEKSLSKRIQQGEEEAKKILINSNLRYVVSIAHKYSRDSESLMDCIQEGNLGLMVAASKYDYKFNTRFSTYANSWITQYILRHKNLAEPAIHIPVLKIEKLRTIKNANSLLEQKLGKIPTNEELSIYTGIDENTLLEYKSYDFSMCSLESKNSDETDTSLLHILSDETTNPEFYVLEKVERQEYMSLIEKLPPKERVVMTHRYNGFIERDHPSYKNIGLKLGVSIEATRQIEIRAKRKLQGIFETYFDEVYNEKIPV